MKQYTTSCGYDSGGSYVEYYTDTDNGSGYGEKPQIQRWYGKWETAPDPDPDLWYPLSEDEILDRTDPGYWIDNF